MAGAPAIYGCDYGRGWLETADITDTIDYSCNSSLISYWKSGGLPQVSLHLANPAFPSGNYKTAISNSQYKNILDPSTVEGKRLEGVRPSAILLSSASSRFPSTVEGSRMFLYWLFEMAVL